MWCSTAALLYAGIMNALGLGYGVCASSWPVITDQADAGEVFSGAEKFISFL